MTSLCLPAHVGAEAAARFFRRPRIGNLFGLLAGQTRVAAAAGGDPATRALPFIERLWMPAFAVRVHAACAKTEHSVWTAVEGINGEFSMLTAALLYVGAAWPAGDRFGIRRAVRSPGPIVREARESGDVSGDRNRPDRAAKCGGVFGLDGR